MNASENPMTKGAVVITGGAGFIGRALVARCLDEGHKVMVIDNLCAGRIENLDPFINRIKFHDIDVLDADGIRSVLARADPGIVFHLAAHHFIPFCNDHPYETQRVNVEGTYVVLNEAARQGVPTAVVASSGALYPSEDEFLNEDLEPKPVDTYGLSKYMAEHVTRFIAKTTGMNCVAARLFNTYGPYETNPHLIPEILQSLRRSREVRLGNLQTKRDYIYVEDVVDLLYRCATRCADPYTVVNIGTGKEYCAEEIVRTIGGLLGYEIRIGTEPGRVRAVDKLHQKADTRRLKALTGAQARYSLVAGLERLLMHEGLTRAPTTEAQP